MGITYYGTSGEGWTRREGEKAGEGNAYSICLAPQTFKSKLSNSSSSLWDVYLKLRVC